MRCPATVKLYAHDLAHNIIPSHSERDIRLAFWRRHARLVIYANTEKHANIYDMFKCTHLSNRNSKQHRQYLGGIVVGRERAGSGAHKHDKYIRHGTIFCPKPHLNREPHE